jgi:mannose-6-phosphate isomerase-like protein (cupin superfamily)
MSEAKFIKVNGTQAKLLPPDGGERYKPTPNENVFFKMGGDEIEGLLDYFDIRVGYLGGPAVHIHLVQHETFHVIEGQLTVKVGDELLEASEGDFLYIPKGVIHTYVNLKEGTIARLVGNLAPGGFNKFVAELSGYQQRVSPPDPKVVNEICARHKQVLVGPPLAVTMGLLKAH